MNAMMEEGDQMQPTNSTPAELRPSGAFLRVEQGALQARIFENTGHIELTGPIGADWDPTKLSFSPYSLADGTKKCRARLCASADHRRLASDKRSL
jgi:hypothetical protein